MKEIKEYKISGIQGVIMDMDGVITQTASIHFDAWKTMFDDFFKSKGSNERLDRFKYDRYLDGKPRYEGVKSYIQASGHDLPYGDPSDSDEKETICGLGNKKNREFLNLIKKHKPRVYEDAKNQIHKWKEDGLKVAIISSSKNASEVLTSAGVIDLFDSRVDGMVSEKRHIKGKPEPDIFLEAAKDLKLSPGKCIVLEDATSGVLAGSKGNFALVVGVSRNQKQKELYYHGADIVVKSIEQLTCKDGNYPEPVVSQTIPSALTHRTGIFEKAGDRELVLFLDYDGTLTPIVSKPEDAIISDKMRDVLRSLSKFIRVSLVSGRDMKNVRDKVQLHQLIYAGSHGYQIQGPDNLSFDKGEDFQKPLDNIQQEIEDVLDQSIYKGSEIERKSSAIAVHYRNLDQGDRVGDMESELNKLLQNYPSLKMDRGKMIFEIKPGIEWHKGKALEWIMDKLNLSEEKYAPVYIGDDTTDEDGFKAISDSGISILVGEHELISAADYSLNDVDEVYEFLKLLKKRYQYE